MAKLTGTVQEAYITARELSRVCVRLRLKMIHECRRQKDATMGSFDDVAIQLCTGVAGTSKLDPLRAQRRLRLIRRMVVEVEEELRAARKVLKRVGAAHCTAGAELAERLRDLIDVRLKELGDDS